jgi:hypothetical protein
MTSRISSVVMPVMGMPRQGKRNLGFLKVDQRRDRCAGRRHGPCGAGRALCLGDAIAARPYGRGGFGNADQDAEVTPPSLRGAFATKQSSFLAGAKKAGLLRYARNDGNYAAASFSVASIIRASVSS